MLSKIPIDIDAISEENIDKEMLRASVIAESDAANLYEQFASSTSDENLKKVMLNVAKEEKTHIGEFQAMLMRLDKEHEQEPEHGDKEVNKMINSAEKGRK